MCLNMVNFYTDEETTEVDKVVEEFRKINKMDDALNDGLAEDEKCKFHSFQCCFITVFR